MKRTEIGLEPQQLDFWQTNVIPVVFCNGRACNVSPPLTNPDSIIENWMQALKKQREVIQSRPYIYERQSPRYQGHDLLHRMKEHNLRVIK